MVEFAIDLYNLFAAVVDLWLLVVYGQFCAVNTDGSPRLLCADNVVGYMIDSKGKRHNVYRNFVPKHQATVLPKGRRRVLAMRGKEVRGYGSYDGIRISHFAPPRQADEAYYEGGPANPDSATGRAAFTIACLHITLWVVFTLMGWTATSDYVASLAFIGCRCVLSFIGYSYYKSIVDRGTRMRQVKIFDITFADGSNGVLHLHYRCLPEFDDLVYGKAMNEEERAYFQNIKDAHKARVQEACTRRGGSHRPHPTCPMCHSQNTGKISGIKRVLEHSTYGWAAPSSGNTFECYSCGYKW